MSQEDAQGRGTGSTVEPTVTAPELTPEPPKRRDRLEFVKDWMSIVQSIVTIIAIIAAGLWFLMQRQHKPRLKVEHRISHRRIAQNEQLLIVDVMLSNVGNIKADLKCGKIKVYEILPDGGVLVNKDDTCNAGQRSLEPGEGDQVHEEYKLDGAVQTVRVYTFFVNPDRPGIGWDLTSFYDFKDVHEGEAKRYTDATPSR